MSLLGFLTFCFGAGCMITLHCTILSMMLYKARRSNVSNILKIIFNFANFIRFLFVFLSYDPPDHVTLLMCKGIQYSLLTGTLFFRTSLSAFLLYRLIQINGNHSKDRWPCIILLLIKVAFSLPAHFTIRIHTLFNPQENKTQCATIPGTIAITSGGGIVTDFIIDIYVTIRLIQILQHANRNARLINVSNSNGRRSPFTAVIYWNFIRLGVGLIYHITGFFETINFFPLPVAPTIAIKTLINIALSYVITVDAEIVRNIEGSDPKMDSSKRKKLDASPKSASSVSSVQYSTKEPPRYSTRTSRTSRTSYDPSLARSDVNDFDEKFTVSMKRLSFFEWANVVVGKRRKYHDDEDDDDDDDGDDDQSKEKAETKVEIEPLKEDFQDTSLMRDIVLAIGDPSIIRDDPSEEANVDVIEVQDEGEVKNEVKDEDEVPNETNDGMVIDEPSSHSEKEDSQEKDEETNDSTLISTHTMDSVIDEPSIIKDDDEIKGSTSISTTLATTENHQQ